MKIEDDGVTAEYIPGKYPEAVDSVRFSKDGVEVDVPIYLLNIAQHAWA